FPSVDSSNLAFEYPSGLQRNAMRLRRIDARTSNRFIRFSAGLLAALTITGCSAKPMTLDQELTTAAVAGVIGAGSGALFAAAAHKSYPASIGIGIGGMAG